MAAELISEAVVVSAGGVMPRGWVLVDEGLIAAVGGDDTPRPRADRTTSVSGSLLMPGFVDVHVHGGGGATFGPPGGVDRAARFHAASGTTALLATVASDAPAGTAEQVRRLASTDERLDGGPRLLGIHLEGPFIAASRRGAHDPGHVRPPDAAELTSLMDAAGGRIRLITLAPELPGAATLIAAAAAGGAVVSAGHTDADAAQLRVGITAGARSLTHTFNQMRGIHHRATGPLEAIAETGVFCELICDGVHVHAPMVRLLRRLAGPDRVVLVTDAVAAAGMPDGDYGAVSVVGGAVRLAGTDTLAGSTLTMARAVRNYALFTGAGAGEVARAAATNPARLLGVDDRLGRIAAGAFADLVVLDASFRLEGVMVGGAWLSTPDTPPAPAVDEVRRSGRAIRGGRPPGPPPTR